MSIRDSIITGTFGIGADGQKEPTDWKKYAEKVENILKQVIKDINPIIGKALAKGTGRASVTDKEIIDFFVNL